MQKSKNNWLRHGGLSHFFRGTYREATTVEYKLPQWYVSARRKIEHNFASENFKGVVEQSPSPCGDYTFVVEKYQKSVGEWDYTYYRGIIYSRITRKEVTTLNSTANKFWHCWIKRDGKTYLICNEDVQGYTVVDVSEGKAYPYIDPKAKDGYGFSWKEVLPSPDGKYLAVQGDYLGTAREVALYDLENLELPLRKVKRLDANITNDSITLKGWNDGKVVMEHMNRGEPTTVEVGV